MDKLLAALSGAPAPAGFEKAVLSIIKSELLTLCPEVRTDNLGNLISLFRSAAPNAPLLMIDAHMDEIGLIVTSIDDNGFLKFACVGSYDTRVLPDSEVIILADSPIPGIICCLPPHVQSASEMDEFVKTGELAIDIGFDKTKASELVKPGTFIASAADFRPLENNRYTGKALDNRACIAAVISALKAVRDLELDYDIAFVASVQEELGTRGAKPAAFSLNPDAAIVLDVTFGASPDTPSGDSFELGKGITLCVGPAVDRKLTGKLFDLTDKFEIPCHPEVYARSTGTNATPIQVSNAGIPVAVISIPLRYMHTPCEVVDFTDLNYASLLLAEFIKNTKGGDLRG